MIEASRTGEFHQSLGEEIANGVSHGVGLLAALVAAPFLVILASRRGDAVDVVGTSVFAAALVILYLSSTLYHVLPRNKAKRVFRIFDHGAIFVLIAGTYTPFTLGVLRGFWGWTLLGLVWSLAVAGLLVTSVAGIRWPRLLTGLYIAMGWLVLIAIQPLRKSIPPAGFSWLLAGGIAYTAGVSFLAAQRKLLYGHFVWHLFVLAGTACHMVAVALYAA